MTHLTRLPTMIAALFIGVTVSSPCPAASPADLFAHPAGIWALPDTQTHNRWVVIHNLKGAKASGVFHIEVIARKKGAPKWSITRLCPHMAITGEALARSVTQPRSSGAVYPEAFDDAYGAWKEGGQKPICSQSVIECLPAE